ncbi:MAG: hypothetical protein J6W44_01370 [Oscillospiraceae bacterium]|nr:hypothetical protein [Oscillospiraceae bacterium]
MLKMRNAARAEINRYYNAVEMDFDERERIPLKNIRRAVSGGNAVFHLFYDDKSNIVLGYAFCLTKSVYGYVLLKYFDILPWYRERGVGVEAMRLLHKQYADRQGILAELAVFDDSDSGDYLRKLKRFFARFGYREVPCDYRIGGADAALTVKPIQGTAELAPIAPRLLADLYSRCLSAAQMRNMLSFRSGGSDSEQKG